MYFKDFIVKIVVSLCLGKYYISREVNVDTNSNKYHLDEILHFK